MKRAVSPKRKSAVRRELEALIRQVCESGVSVTETEHSFYVYRYKKIGLETKCGLENRLFALCHEYGHHQCWTSGFMRKALCVYDIDPISTALEDWMVWMVERMAWVYGEKYISVKRRKEYWKAAREALATYKPKLSNRYVSEQNRIYLDSIRKFLASGDSDEACGYYN